LSAEAVTALSRTKDEAATDTHERVRSRAAVDEERQHQGRLGLA